MEELREKWGSKVEELREKMRHRSWGAGEGGGVMAGADKEKTPLLLLARMYMQDQSAIEELQDFWTLHPKWTEFFLPQVGVWWERYLCSVFHAVEFVRPVRRLP